MAKTCKPISIGCWLQVGDSDLNSGGINLVAYSLLFTYKYVTCTARCIASAPPHGAPWIATIDSSELNKL